MKNLKEKLNKISKTSLILAGLVILALASWFLIFGERGQQNEEIIPEVKGEWTPILEDMPDIYGNGKLAKLKIDRKGIGSGASDTLTISSEREEYKFSPIVADYDDQTQKELKEFGWNIEIINIEDLNNDGREEVYSLITRTGANLLERFPVIFFVSNNKILAVSGTPARLHRAEELEIGNHLPYTKAIIKNKFDNNEVIRTYHVEGVNIESNKINLFFITDNNCRACEHDYRRDICVFTDEVRYESG